MTDKITLKNTVSGDTYELVGAFIEERESNESTIVTAADLESDEWEVLD